MSLELFHKVPAGAIETLFDEQNQPLFKKADLGHCLGIENIKHNFKEFPSHYTRPRLDLKGGRLSSALGREKIPMISSLIWMVLYRWLYDLKNPRQLP